MAKKISEFSKYVAEKRLKSKLSYQDIADAVGVSRPYIYDIEKGNNKPPLDYAKLDSWATYDRKIKPEENVLLNHYRIQESTTLYISLYDGDDVPVKSPNAVEAERIMKRKNPSQ